MFELLVLPHEFGILTQGVTKSNMPLVRAIPMFDNVQMAILRFMLVEENSPVILARFAEDVPEWAEQVSVCVGTHQCRNGNLDIDDRLCGKPRHCRAPDVVHLDDFVVCKCFNNLPPF